MKQFATLFRELDQTTKTNVKINVLCAYFKQAPDEDKLWTIALFSHRRPRRTINTTLLRHWAAEIAKLPLWLFEESYHVVGDLAETIALILPESQKTSTLTLTQCISIIQELKTAEEEEKKNTIVRLWNEMSRDERFLLNKIITGGFRVGVSQKLVIKALAKATQQQENVIAHRLTGEWSPQNSSFSELILYSTPADIISKPYPFYLAYALDKELQKLGHISEWQAEWKWDGIRGQLIKRKGAIFIWTRGEELVTPKYPELHSIKEIPEDNFVMDGEILAFKNGIPMSFNALQTRIGRKTISKKLLLEAPVVFMAYDLLEFKAEDIRNRPLWQRREILESLLKEIKKEQIDPPIRLSELVVFPSWEDLAKTREKSRSKNTEGLMLKLKDSTYKTGRKKGEWWKWKVDPLSIDAVMIYAMRGHGRRANLYTDFTFAVWDGKKLVPFTKAYSGLTDAEFNEITRFVQRNTIDRFGPVRAVQPTLVFEIAFEGINTSKRHKSGIALRFPRMKRWRKDKHPKEANTLEDLHNMLQIYG